MRYVIQLAYNGRNYHGWQLQNNAHSVQAELNKALSTLITNDIETIGCGRTDAGVHAKHFYAQFDSEEVLKKGFIFKLNRVLPNDIAAYELFKVSETTNVRFDATYRLYEYFLHQKPNPFIEDTSYYRYGKIDFEVMNKAAKILFNHTDFECFSKVHTDVRTFNCVVTEAQWEEYAPHQWKFTIKADRFLRNMVRAIVGSLIDVGTGKIDTEGFENIIKSKKRTEAGQSVPAHALYLADIGYGEEMKNWQKIDG